MSLLPTEIVPHTTDPSRFTYLIYGGPGIGKTTFISGLPDVLIVDTEQGTKFIDAFTVAAGTWDQFCKVIDEFLLGQHKFKSIAIDTVGPLLRSCIHHCMKKMGITHPAEGQWGRGWDSVKVEWDKQMSRIIQSPYGLWLVAHEQTRTITAGHSSKDFLQPDIVGYVSRIIAPNCDFIFLARTVQIPKEIQKGDKTETHYIPTRVLETRPTTGWMAKVRTQEHMEFPARILFNTQAFLDALQKALGTESNDRSEQLIN